MTSSPISNKRSIVRTGAHDVDDSIEGRIHAAGLVLPEVAPTGQFLAVQVTNGIAYVSGHAPYDNGTFLFQGKVGREFDLTQGQAAAVAATLGCLASVNAILGSLAAVSKVLKVNGYVNCTPEFTALPMVMNAASDVLVAIWGEAGRHARTTVGVASLPMGVAVEVELVLELTSGRGPS
jgi:enamine deaminase RidA (YjgF/YER057c/UK114 family)